MTSFPRIRKAVFPVAGMGTRFLPATKATPKEMLPIVDKPLIQYAVEEAVEAGISDLIFVTSSTKRAIEDHFDSNYELESRLTQTHKSELLTLVRNVLPTGIQTAYTRQPEARGLGDAVNCAHALVDDEPFAVLLADDLIDAHPGCLSQMLSVYEQTGCSVVAIESVPLEETSQYGVVGLTKESSGLQRITQIVEKPQSNPPSQFAVVGRYILTPRIFTFLDAVSADNLNEIQLTDAIAALMEVEPVYAVAFSGMRYDCGQKLGYLIATFALGQKHPEVGTAFTAHVQKWLQ